MMLRSRSRNRTCYACLHLDTVACVERRQQNATSNAAHVSLAAVSDLTLPPPSCCRGGKIGSEWLLLYWVDGCSERVDY